MALEEAPDRHLGRLDANPFEYPPLKLGQGQIALSGDDIQKPCRMGFHGERLLPPRGRGAMLPVWP